MEALSKACSNDRGEATLDHLSVSKNGDEIVVAPITKVGILCHIDLQDKQVKKANS